MKDYLSINEVIALISETKNCTFKLIPRKKIMFITTVPNSGKITLCTPQSKFHPQGFYWVDITEKQCDLLDKTNGSLVIFRLEGRKLVTIQWVELKKYLIPECMRFNSKEQNHWKLNIHNDHIKISGNQNICSINSVQY